MRVHEQRDQLAAIVAAYEDGLQDLRLYLSSPKFDEDTTVQVADVLRRLSGIQLAVNDAAYGGE